VENRFDRLAKEWDSKPMRVEGAMRFANKIKEYIKDDIKNFKIMDYGCGSGLVSFCFANDVKEINGYDKSKGMIDVYNEKAKKLGFKNIIGIVHDIDKEDLKSEQYDIIMTNMTMHHIKSVDDFVKKLANGLKKDGKLFIADLYKEDGTFHSDNTDVIHFGFEIEDVRDAFNKAGLKSISISKLQTIKKPNKNYDLFFAVGVKGC